MDRNKAEKLLEAAAQAQTAFWRALRELEEEIGVDLESTQDLEGIDVNTLIELAEGD